MANPLDKPRQLPPGCVYDGPALAVPPGQRVRSKRFGHFDDPVIPRSYWYLTACLVASALVIGLLVGRFLLG